MKAHAIIIASIFTTLGGWAQQVNKISGRVTDSLTSQSVPFATVVIMANKENAVQKIVADSAGNYLFTNVAAGRYQLVITAVGYKVLTSAVLTVTNTSIINNGTHLLPPANDTLANVTVYAAKPLVAAAIDGFTYQASNDIIAAGTSAGDLLRKVPLLTVDQNGAPSLRGSANIKVFIDDKPSDIYAGSVADALKQIPAEDILRIEVILYPSAKYDAEGTDGVINIVTRKSRFNAVNATLRSRIGNRMQDLSANLNIRQGKWIFNTDVGQYWNTYFTTSTFYRAAGKNVLQQQNETVNHGNVLYTGTNMMYVINDLQTISGGYRFRLGHDDNNRKTANNYYEDNNEITAFDRNTDGALGSRLNMFNVGYNGKSRDQKKQYSLLATYFKQATFNQYQMDQSRTSVVDYKEHFRNDLSNGEWALQADYVHEISKRITIDAGAKSMFRKYTSENGYHVYNFSTDKYFNDLNRSNQFSYDRAIYALYSNVTIRLNSWQLRIGGRFEQTDLQANFKGTATTIPNYGNFVPAVLLTKTFNEKHILKWSYGKRILRPYLDALNPIVNYVDSFNIQSGNPYLVPEITNRFETGYTYNGKQLFMSATLYYNNVRNGIEQVRLPYNGNVFINTYQNIGHSDIIGFSYSFTWKWKQKIAITAVTNLRYNHLESTTLQLSNKGFIYGGNINLSYTIGKGYSIEATGYTNSPEINLQGKREAWTSYALILSKRFKGDKLAASFRAENFLPPSTQSLQQTWISPFINQVSSTRFQNQYFWLGISWKLGKKEIKTPAVRQSSINEE